MILEDEISLAYTLSATLEKKLGEDTVVKICTTAEAALLLLQIHTFDLIISDWQLPGMSGLGFITQVRESYPNMPIIFMTAFTSEDVEEQAQKVSNYYIPKPFEVSEFIDAVEQLLGMETEYYLSPDSQLVEYDESKASNRHLLVLEDDRSLTRLYQKVFSKIGFVVHTAETLQEAGILLHEKDFDIFICDVKLEKGIGIDLLLIWNDKLLDNNTKVIVVSGDSWYSLLSKKIGADYFFQKPIEIGVLVNLVRNSVPSLGAVPNKLQ